jgi:hypothetical protein
MGTVARIEREKCTQNAGSPEWEKPLWTRKWENNIKTDLKRGVRMWTAFNQLRIGSNDELL